MAKQQSAKDQRQCLVTREILAKADLLRFVTSPDDNVIFDVNNKLPGKGMWIKADKESIFLAFKKNVFKQVNKKSKLENINIDIVLNQLKQYLLGQLSMMNKAGLLLFGQDRIGALLDKDKVFALIITKDSSQNSKNKLQSHISKNMIIVDCFENKDMENIFPNEKISFIGLSSSKMVEKFINQFAVYDKLARG